MLDIDLHYLFFYNLIQGYGDQIEKERLVSEASKGYM